MIGYIAIAGDLINWLWSFRDFGTKNLQAYNTTSKPSSRLLSLKTERRILWGFGRQRDFDKLSELVSSHDTIRVVLIANSVRSRGETLSKRGVIGFGKITKDMLVGKDPWNYWPILPKGGMWDWKFYIEVEYVMSKLLDNINNLKSINKSEFNIRQGLGPNITKIIKECSVDILTLIPSNVTQGSLFSIEEHEYYTLEELAKKRWRKKIRLSDLTLDHVLNIIKEHDLYYPENVLVAAIAALKSGKHLLLMGAPATGKSMLAKVLAEALGFELYSCTASSTWTRYDFIGGPVLGEGGRLEWRCGHLLRALAKHLELESRGGGGGVILLIEELNRAEADKVLAEFFTMFPSSNPEEWRFPEGLVKEIKAYEERGFVDEDAKKILKYIKENNCKLPREFRVIATVNTFDRAHLFRLGHALQRRFAIIEISPPENEKEEVEIVKSQFERRCISVDKKAEEIINETVNLIRTLRDITRRPLGIGITVDTAILAYEIVNSSNIKDVRKAVEEAAKHVALSQLELLGEDVKDIASKLRERKYNVIAEEIERIADFRWI